MRFLQVQLPDGAQCTPFAQTAQAFRERQLAPPYPGLSLEILAVMAFPGDPERQNEFYVAYDMAYPTPAKGDRQKRVGPDRESAGKIFLDLIGADLATSQSIWRNAGDQLLILSRMIATDEISETASLSKARHLLETTHAPNRQKLETDWTISKDIAHLAAAACFLIQRAIATDRERPDFNIIAAIFANPITLLCLARCIQDTCLEFVPRGSREPVLSPETLWRVPPEFPALPVKFKPLLAEHLGELFTYSGRRGPKTFH